MTLGYCKVNSDDTIATITTTTTSSSSSNYYYYYYYYYYYLNLCHQLFSVTFVLQNFWETLSDLLHVYSEQFKYRIAYSRWTQPESDYSHDFPVSARES